MVFFPIACRGASRLTLGSCEVRVVRESRETRRPGMMAPVSYTHLDVYKRQMVLAVGFVAMIIISKIDYHIYSKFAALAYICLLYTSRCV